MGLNLKLEEQREYVAGDVGLEVKVAKLTEIVEVLLEHAPEYAKQKVNALLGG